MKINSNLILNILICYCFIMPTVSFANKIASQGQLISADKINSSISQIGEIKLALLTQSEFQSLNGNCWVIMNGQDISNSDYANLTGRSTLPNASGKFLRNFGSETVALGNTQEDAFQGHRFWSGVLMNSTAAGLTGVYGNTQLETPGLATGNMGAAGGAGNRQTLTSLPKSDNTNGTPRIANETRPKNLVVNTFIKINKECNFN